MDKVHIIRWTGNMAIFGVYADYDKACRVSEENNKIRGWHHKVTGDKWIVQTYDVKD